MFHCTLLSSKRINMFCCSDHHHQTTNRRCDATVTSMTQHRTAHWFNSSLLEPRIRVSVTEGRTNTCWAVFTGDARWWRAAAAAVLEQANSRDRLICICTVSIAYHWLFINWRARGVRISSWRHEHKTDRDKDQDRERERASQCGWCNKCLRPGGKSHKYTRAAGYNVTHTL